MLFLWWRAWSSFPQQKPQELEQFGEESGSFEEQARVNLLEQTLQVKHQCQSTHLENPVDPPIYLICWISIYFESFLITLYDMKRSSFVNKLFLDSLLFVVSDVIVSICMCFIHFFKCILHQGEIWTAGKKTSCSTGRHETFHSRIPSTQIFHPLTIGCLPFYLRASKNRGTPKWIVYNRKTLWRWMIWGYHHFRKHPIACVFLIQIPWFSKVVDLSTGLTFKVCVFFRHWWQHFTRHLKKQMAGVGILCFGSSGSTRDGTQPRSLCRLGVGCGVLFVDFQKLVRKRYTTTIQDELLIARWFQIFFYVHP